MFHCNNNNTMCQRNPEREAEQSETEFLFIDGLCVSQDALTPVSLRSESAVTRPGSKTSVMTADL